MKNLLGILIVISHFSLFAQKHYDSDCFLDKKYDNNAVNEFKDKLTATVNINELTIGAKMYNVKFNHTEQFNTETSLIRINDTLGIKISIARIIDYGRKKYLKQLVLLKYDGCWKDVCIFNWETYELGTINTGYSSGEKGDKDYLGIVGSITVE
jgi:hypothetical protein